MPDIKIYDEYETIMKIYTDKCSICRYGDGEIYHLFQHKTKYGSGGQQCSINFQKKLIEVLHNTNPKILIGFSGYYCENEFINTNYILNSLSESTKKFILETKPKLQMKFPFLFIGKLYSAEITRLAQLKNNKQIIDIYNKLFCENNCIFVGNNKIIQLIKNKIIDKFKQIEFIETPNTNAYDQYENIINKIIENDNLQDKLILISLGPTATIMSYDLAQKNHWSLDIGHYFEIYVSLQSK